MSPPERLRAGTRCDGTRCFKAESVTVAHQLHRPIEFLLLDCAGEALLQLTVDLHLHAFDLIVGTTGFKHHQAAEFQRCDIHVDGFNDLQFLPQSLNQSAASTLGQDRGGQISAGDRQLIVR